MIQSLPKLIIGQSIESLLYAWRTQTKIIVKDPQYVFRHDPKLVEHDFSFMNAENPKQFYNNLTFALSITSLLVCPNNVSNFRETDGLVEIITKGNRKVKLEADEIIYFDKLIDQYDVYDFFDVREMSWTDVNIIEDKEEDFIHQINFYHSPRTDNNRSRDIVASSRMTQKQLLSPDWGQGIAMLKMLRMLKSAGVNGKYAWTRKDTRYYKRPKLEFYRRVVAQKCETKHTFKEIYEMKQEEGDPWKTLEKMRKREETSSG